jgi:RNA-directed DNA polymerase
MTPTVREIQRFLHQHARRYPSRPVNHLMRFVTDWAVIQEAWRRVRSSPGANTPGADRIAARDLPPGSVETRAFLHDLAEQLQSGQYRPGPVRRFEIPKPHHPDQTRPLAILTLADRVVQMTLKLILEPIVEARLGKRCFGFRPGRNRYDQIQSVRRLVAAHPEEYGAALSADVHSCFDKLDHQLIIDDVRQISGDGDLLGLFRVILNQVGAGQVGWWHKRPIGVLQGSPLSPLLANWNLTRFDLAWRQQHGDRAPLFRYADDLIILARDPGAAEQLRSPLRRCLRQANHLDLAPEKARVATLDDGVPLLGLLVRRHGDPFAHHRDVRIFIDPDPFRDVLAEIDDWVEQLDPDRSLGSQFNRLNDRLRGWFDSYQYAYDAAQAFESLDRHLFVSVRHRLKEILRCSSLVLNSEHHHRLPTGHHTWRADGVCLLVLSALPRRYYQSSRIRPPWETDAEPEAEAEIDAAAGAEISPQLVGESAAVPSTLNPDQDLYLAFAGLANEGAAVPERLPGDPDALVPDLGEPAVSPSRLAPATAVNGQNAAGLDDDGEPEDSGL